MKRTINFAAGEIHCDETFVGGDQRRRGIAKGIMRNSITLADDFEFDRVTIFARVSRSGPSSTWTTQFEMIGMDPLVPERAVGPSA
jgi:hypothetical protein